MAPPAEFSTTTVNPAVVVLYAATERRVFAVVMSVIIEGGAAELPMYEEIIKGAVAKATGKVTVAAWYPGFPAAT